MFGWFGDVFLAIGIASKCDSVIAGANQSRPCVLVCRWHFGLFINVDVGSHIVRFVYIANRLTAACNVPIDGLSKGIMIYFMHHVCA